MSNARRRAAVLVLPCALLLAGCHDARDAIGDAGFDVDAKSGIGAAAIVAGPSPATALRDVQRRPAEALQLPADFPGDVYVPAGYRVDSVMDSGALQVVSLRARGRVSTLFADARRAMRAQGWTSTLAMQNAADSAMLSCEKDSRAAVLSFSPGQDGGDVTMSVQLRRAP